MPYRTYSLSPELNQLLDPSVTENAAQLASKVLQLSNFYLENPGHPTPWEKDFCREAYLSYFLPLNFIRLKAAFQEVKRFLPANSISEVWDYGSGLGTTQWVLESESEISPVPLITLEKSTSAQSLHWELLDKMLDIKEPRWRPDFIAPAPPARNSMAVFSYSFLEMQNHLPNLKPFSHVLIVEPSTRDCGRQLMEWREKFLTMGFEILAPCTHRAACPLLTQSNRDWCHQRVHFAPPTWFSELEAHLPMKNRTLTFSYLLLSQTVKDETWRGAGRVIGDTLVENGKTKQMVCRGPNREFLSWLHRHGEPPQIPHGALVRGVEKCEVKGAELRAVPDTLEWTE